MDTTKILAFRHPSQTELLLQSFLSQLGRLPPRARQVIDRSDLPSALQKLAIHSVKNHVHWAAWIHGEIIWFFTAELTPTPAGHGSGPTLKISRFNPRGRLEEYGLWVNVPRRGWQRCIL